MKIYQSILDKNLSISIDVKGYAERINFSGGDENSNGIYATNNPAIQNALESSHLFNSLYRIKENYSKNKTPLAGPGVAIEGTVTKESLVGTGVLDTIQKEVPAIEITEGETPVVFTNIADAQEYFLKNYEVPKYKLRTSKQVLDMAIEKNILVEFNR